MVRRGLFQIASFYSPVPRADSPKKHNTHAVQKWVSSLTYNFVNRNRNKLVAPLPIRVSYRSRDSTPVECPIVPMLDAISLDKYMKRKEASNIANAKMEGNNLAEDSWKLAILLNQKKITNDEYRRIVDFYVDTIAKKPRA